MTDTPKRKFVIEGDTIDDLVLGFAQVVKATQDITIKDRVKGTGQYGVWKSAPVPGKSVPLKAGIPLEVSLDVIFHALTDVAHYDNAMTQRRAATLNSIESLKARLGRLEQQAK